MRFAWTESERYWRGLFEGLRDGFLIGELVRDADGRAIDCRYREANRAWGVLTGVEPSTALGRTYREVFPGIEEQWIDEAAEVVATGQPTTFTRRLGILDRWYEGRVHKLSADSFAVLFSDNTERQRAAERERENEAFLARILASSDDCIKVLDLDGGLTFMSEGGKRVMEVSDFNAILGCPWPEFWEGQAKLDAIAAVEAARAGGTGQFQGFATTMAGTPKWWDVQVTPILGADGRPEKLLSVSRDITAARRAEEALREAEAINAEHLRNEIALASARDAAASADRAKSEFLVTMSHEIRTPMTAILGMADLLALEEAPPRFSRYIENIRTSGRQLLSVINNVLDIAKVEQGEIELERISFSVGHVLEEVLSILRPQANEKGIALTSALPDPPLPRFDGDPTRLRQVLLNLAGNAVKFTKKGEVTITVSQLPAGPGSGRLRLEVRDTGMGIAPEQLEILFQPFAQGDSSILRRFGGSGLGLTISKRLVEAMGGEIGVSSTPEIGSCFWFELVLAESTRPQPPAMAVGPVQQLPPLRILLAEDAPLNRELVTTMLGHFGHHVVEAADGVAAVAAYQREPFDVVLMDVQMPVMGGEEATRRIRGLVSGAAVPIIALTANVVESERTRFMAAGMDAYVGKPVTWSTLVAVIARCLEERAAQAAASASSEAEFAAPPLIDEVTLDASLAQVPIAKRASYVERAIREAEAALIRLRAANGDLATLGVIAHQLGGTAATFGLAAIAQIARDVETQAMHGRSVEHFIEELASTLDATTAAHGERFDRHAAHVSVAAPSTFGSKLARPNRVST